MFKRNVCTNIREICFNAFVEHVISCDTSSRRVVFERKISLKKVVVKISTWRIASMSIVFPIVETTVKDSWNSVLSTIGVMSRVLWLETSEKEVNPWT